MKKNLLNFSVKTIAVMAILVIFTMCKRETECTKNCVVPPPDAKELVAFDLMDKSIQAECSFYKGIDNGYSREIVFLSLDHERLFQFIRMYCISNNIIVNNQTMAFVLYYDSIVSQSYKIIDEHIKGISIYNVEGRKIMHHLCIKNEKSDFYEIENVNVAVPFLTTNQVHFYLENYVFSDPQNKSFISIMGDFSDEVNKNIRKYNTRMRYEVKASKAPIGGIAFGSCGSPCPVRIPNMGCKYDKWDYGECVEGHCVARAADSRLTVAQKIERTFINIDLMHSFRDLFLYNSEKGETYVDNYYYLSGEYEGKIGLSLAVQTALFFRKFNSVMEACVNPGGRQSEIMFDNTLTQSLLELLDEYEAITTSREGKAILASVKADVNRFNGKTLQELLAVFQ
ncbi:MAG: hypothetical protein FWC10_07205 [Lentimicrobiaceae bacterium]|nr:hypothetical protein [Lentimicrobiaceae bacterium]